MRNVYTVGETVYDIIFKNGNPIEARPGGAMLNTAVSIGRLGIPVHLVGDYANDPVGDIIEKFLVNNQVSTKYVSRYDEGKSRLALAFLDDENNAAYSFYKIQKKSKAEIRCPEFKENDIVLFGSFYGIKDEVRSDLLYILKTAKKNNAIILYDPNFRKAHLGILPEVMPFLKENLALSDIVKGSDEDFANIFNTNSHEDVARIVKHTGKAQLIYTANKHGVWLHSSVLHKHYPTPAIQPLSTIGAGDTFNAGLIYSLIKNNITYSDIQNIKMHVWDNIIDTAIQFATHVCLNYDNYISQEFAEKYMQAIDV